MKISHKPLLSMLGSLALVFAVSDAAVAQNSMPWQQSNAGMAFGTFGVLAVASAALLRVILPKPRAKAI